MGAARLRVPSSLKATQNLHRVTKNAEQALKAHAVSVSKLKGLPTVDRPDGSLGSRPRL